VKVRVERANDALFAASLIQDLRIAGRAEIALKGMDDVPAVPTEQFGGGARESLVEQQSDQAASNGWI
jgi:hypothetical protein